MLFDVDGTLVDTTYIHAVCWAEALRQHGHEVTMADVHHAIGMSSSQLLEHCLGEHDTDGDEAIITAHSTLYREHWGRLVPLPGARDLLHACAERGLRVVLASSAKAEELDMLRGLLDSDDVITEATSSADASEGKPAPDILQAALDGSGLSPERVVFVGDAVWDAKAAERAGVPFVGVTCGGTPGPQLREAGAVDVRRDPADLLAHLHEGAIGGLSR